jgi:hypothetical protein
VSGDGFDVSIGTLALTGVDAYGVSWRTTDLTGWAGSPSSTLSPVQKTRNHGAWLSPRYLTPRTIAPGGYIDAPDRPSARAAIDRLNAAVSLDAARFTVVEDDSTRYCTVYRQDEVLQNWLTDTVVQWSAQVVAVDPRKMADPDAVSTGLPSGTGGLTIPFTVPFAITSTIVTGNAILTNPGNTSGPVRLRINGPIVGPAVTHVSTGLALTFSSDLALGDGEWIDVDMEAQTVLANGQSSRNGDVTSRGWFGFDPGANVFSFTATSGTGTLTVTATPAWL